MGARGGGGDRGGRGGNADERQRRIVEAGPAAPGAAACARVCGGITGVSASPPRVARARGTVHVRTDGSSYVHSNGNTVRYSDRSSLPDLDLL